MYEIRLLMLLNFNVYIFRYGLMTRCWNLNPDFRPLFENLRKRMDKYIREEVSSDETINSWQNSMDLDQRPWRLQL